MRDIDKIARAGAEKIKNNERRSLYAADIIMLVDESNLTMSDGLLDLITKVYSFGFEEGYRERQAREKRRNEVLTHG